MRIFVLFSRIFSKVTHYSIFASASFSIRKFRSIRHQRILVILSFVGAPPHDRLLPDEEVGEGAFYDLITNVSGSRNVAGYCPRQSARRAYGVNGAFQLHFSAQEERSVRFVEGRKSEIFITTMRGAFNGNTFQPASISCDHIQ